MTYEEFMERQADPTPETIFRWQAEIEERREKELQRCIESWKPYFDLKKMPAEERDAIQARVFEQMLKEAEGAVA